ncbi:TfoX/Sxy family protein [Tsukamurella spumae]|uniref:TfoX/Sxy family protein n=1 Tax=Tsukamurella spumae TaxID=44753 RepID=A0A846X182_9ACTN|nr:TfoX/Sxy family protein [Tsukamurella spumae]NKY18002.1 TfoX/Sxy family protein [Tsukamurella spumae]
MAYDEGLADRIRDAIDGEPGVTEKRMFGGLAFLVDGHMAIAANSRGEAMVHLHPDVTDGLIGPHVRATVMRGREMRGWLDLSAEATASDVELAEWVRRTVDYVRSLPPK